MLTFRARTRADCAIKKAIHVEKTAPCIHRSNGLGGLAWKRLLLTVRLKPAITRAANTNDMQR